MTPRIAAAFVKISTRPITLPSRNSRSRKRPAAAPPTAVKITNLTGVTKAHPQKRGNKRLASGNT